MMGGGCQGRGHSIRLILLSIDVDPTGLVAPGDPCHYHIRGKGTMQITRCLHAFVQVTDLAKAEHFYGTVLGLQKIDRTLNFPGAWYEIAGFQIHLATVATLPPDPAPAAKWGRNRHIAFAVADLAVAKAELLDQSCPVQMSASGRAALFTQDPDGHVIEISQALATAGTTTTVATTGAV